LVSREFGFIEVPVLRGSTVLKIIYKLNLFLMYIMNMDVAIILIGGNMWYDHVALKRD